MDEAVELMNYSFCFFQDSWSSMTDFCHHSLLFVNECHGPNGKDKERTGKT